MKKKTKYCNRCKKDKPVSDFSYRWGKEKKILRGFCKKCCTKLATEWRAKNRKKYNKYHNDYYKIKIKE